MTSSTELGSPLRFDVSDVVGEHASLAATYYPPRGPAEPPTPSSFASRAAPTAANIGTCALPATAGTASLTSPPKTAMPY